MEHYSTIQAIFCRSIAVLTIVLLFTLLQQNYFEFLEKLLEIPSTSLLLWTMLPVYFFYGTGHQPTFPNIVWEAAFIGTGENFSNNFIPGALIIMNTFGSYMMIGFMLPLLQIAPFTLYTMVSSLGSKKNEFQRDITTKGDILLYENEDTLYHNLFTLCCKYLSCHALRVRGTLF